MFMCVSIILYNYLVTKIKLFLLFIIAVFAGYFYLSRQKLTAPIVIPPVLHPLSIEALRLHQFPDQPLTIVSEVSANSSIVSYSSDGLKLYALMITPKGTSPPGGWPIIIINHGHIPPSQYSTTQSYINTSNYFASQGFLVLKPDFRGHDKSEGVWNGSLLSRSEYTVDVLNLISTVNSIPNINPNRLFMYGHSMGGDVTLQVLEITSKIKAATLWAPAVTTMPEAISYFVKNRSTTSADFTQFNIQYPEFTAKYPISQISPFDNLDKLSTPLNLHQGTADQSVPYAWGVTFDDKLKSLNKTVNFYSYPNDNHDIAGHFTVALSRDVDFFNSIK